MPLMFGVMSFFFPSGLTIYIFIHGAGSGPLDRSPRSIP
jgi:membrane protein insertase Oxa1/YidC/SpoIIIJ